MKITGAEIIVECLIEEGVDVDEILTRQTF